jgi:hypothetical protein
MPKSKRKFIEWTFRDEATNKEHPIQVYTMVENETISFEAEVKHPEKFTDRDENANTLKRRVLERCKAKRKHEWKPYILVTVSHEGFTWDPMNFTSAHRNYSGIGLLFEPFESAVLGDGTRIWRGVAGKSTRFTAEAKPGWPKTGPTERGGVCRHFEDTYENQERLKELASMFAQVARSLVGSVTPVAVADAMPDALRACKLSKDPALNPESHSCPESNPVSSSEPSEPSAATTSAPRTAGSSQAT